MTTHCGLWRGGETFSFYTLMPNLNLCVPVLNGISETVLGGSVQIDLLFWLVSQVALVVKNLPVNAGDIRDMGSIPGLGRFPGGGDGNPL